MSDFEIDEEVASRRYKKISMRDRMTLIELVLEKGKSIKASARKLRISPSTAREIVRKFQTQGKVFESQSQKLQR